MDDARRGLRSPRGKLWGLLALLIAVNLALMAVDSLVLPAQGVTEVASLNPPRRSETRPLPRPAQLDLFMRRFGIRPVGTEQRPQPATRPFPTEGRPATAQAGPPSSLRPFSLHAPGWGGMALHLVGLLALLSTSIVLTFFLPDRFRVMRDVLGGSWSHRLRTMAIGLSGYLAALLLAFLLAVVVSGLPYTLFVLAVLTAVTAIGVTAVSLALGRWVSAVVGAGRSPLAHLLIGVLLFFPFTILPYAGWAAAGIAASFGMGAILLTRMGSGRPWSLAALQDHEV